MFHAITFTFQRQNNCICRCWFMLAPYSHRTRESGCRLRLRRFANFYRFKSYGSCNQRKSVLVAYCVRSLVDTRSVLTGDLQQKKQG